MHTTHYIRRELAEVQPCYSQRKAPKWSLASKGPLSSFDISDITHQHCIFLVWTRRKLLLSLTKLKRLAARLSLLAVTLEQRTFPRRSLARPSSTSVLLLTQWLTPNRAPSKGRMARSTTLSIMVRRTRSLPALHRARTNFVFSRFHVRQDDSYHE